MIIRGQKSHYKIKDNFLITKLSVFILLCTIILLMYINQNSAVYNIGYICMNISCLFYFAGRYYFVKKNINKNDLELTDYSKRIFTRHRIILWLFLITTSISNVIYLYFIYSEYYNIKVWVWYIFLIPVLYSDSVYLSGITAFGEQKYASGEYIIEYSDIDNICELKNGKSTQGNMVLITLWKDNVNFGYDKLFVDEYHKLRLLVYQNRGNK